MSYKNYAAINKINKLQNELDEYKQNKIEVIMVSGISLGGSPFT